MVLGSGCCYDANSNSICDNDESDTAPAVVTTAGTTDNAAPAKARSADEIALEEQGKKLGRYYEKGDSAAIYELLTPEKQALKTKQEFMDLYPFVMYGSIEYYTDALAVQPNTTFENPYTSVVVKSVEVDGDNGYVMHEIVFDNTLGWPIRSPVRYFKKIDTEWKFDGLNALAYGGCFNNSQCYEYNITLIPLCNITCERNSGLPLHQDDPLLCEMRLCKCKCYNNVSKRGRLTYPDYDQVDLI